MLLVNTQLGQYLLPELCFFLRTTDICFLNKKNSKILYQTYFILLATSMLQLTVQNLNVKCHETAANMEIFRYSPYKNHCTIKCFIAINLNVAACFIWFIWRQLKRCRYIWSLWNITTNPGDALLFDKGFAIQHLLLTKERAIFIPPFLGGKDAFTKEEVMLTKWIAKTRHVWKDLINA